MENEDLEQAKRDEFYKRQVRGIKKFFTNKKFPIIFVIVSIFFIDITIIYLFLLPSNLEKNILAISSNNEEVDDGDKDNCNTVGIRLYGDLVTYALNSDQENVWDSSLDESSSNGVYFGIKDAKEQEDIKAIVIEVDSFGGIPAAAEEINLIIKNTDKPVIAYIRNAGLSAAYWAISGADRIFSLSTSQVGSIAITSSYTDDVKNNEKNGHTFNDLSTGEFKNTFNPNKSLTEKEKKLIMDDLQLTHNIFVETVASNRNLDINNVKKIANGWAYTGNEALSLGLVDEIGNLDSVKDYLKNNILDGEEAEVCWK